MSKTMQLIVAGVVLLAWTADAVPIPVDLRTWTKEGPPNNGTWNVASGGNSVTQSINGNPTFFVSPDTYINTTITGKVAVLTTLDDDYIGFVFGYQKPLAAHNDPTDDNQFYLFDWKQASQDEARAGFSLVKVDGVITDYMPSFWDHTNNPPTFEVLATDYGTNRGWAANTEYEFSLLYTESRIKIDVKGGTGAFLDWQTIFDVPGTFAEGRFGFYNYSQSSVRYRSFTTQAIPEPASLALVLGTLGAWAAGGRRRVCAEKADHSSDLLL